MTADYGKMLRFNWITDEFRKYFTIKLFCREKCRRIVFRKEFAARRRTAFDTLPWTLTGVQRVFYLRVGRRFGPNNRAPDCRPVKQG
jgi:hypothetical protein